MPSWVLFLEEPFKGSDNIFLDLVGSPKYLPHSFTLPVGETLWQQKWLDSYVFPFLNLTFKKTRVWSVSRAAGPICVPFTFPGEAGTYPDRSGLTRALHTPSWDENEHMDWLWMYLIHSCYPQLPSTQGSFDPRGATLEEEFLFL